jgi:hypothetical protein
MPSFARGSPKRSEPIGVGRDHHSFIARKEKYELQKSLEFKEISTIDQITTGHSREDPR